MSLRRSRFVVTAAVVGALAVGSVVAVRLVTDEPSEAFRPPPPTAVDGTNPFRTGHTLVIPHGGGDGLFPEDTLYAYEQTMAMGADVVDVDLRLSRDGVIVAFHDISTDRMTGVPGTVADMTYAQLSALDAGWSFAPAGDSDSHPYRGIGITVPTLESILDEFPTTLLSLDLKDETDDMVQPLCAILLAHHRTDDVFVGSNSDPQIVTFREECPDVRTSAVMADVYEARDARASNDPDFTPAVTVDQPPFRSGGRQLVDAASLTWSHEHGIAILTWVVNDDADLRLLVSLGVDGIYTSYPDRLLRLLDRCTARC